MVSMHSIMFRALFGGENSRRGRGVARKPKKVPKPDWFSECTMQQLKGLCKACKLAVGGNKEDLIGRLYGCDAAQFASNKKGILVTLEECKGLCRTKMLQVGGTKFDLVLRILQHDHGTGGDSLKRAATAAITTENGEEQHVAKKSKTTESKPKPSAFASKVQKKIHAVSQKKYQTYWGAKEHGPDVVDLLHDLVRQAEEYIEKDPKLSYALFEAIFTSFTRNFHVMERPGYCEGMESFVHSLYTNFKLLEPHLNQEQLNSAVHWLQEFEDVCHTAALLEYVDEDSNVQAILRFLKGEEEEDAKVAAVTLDDGTSATALPLVTPHAEAFVTAAAGSDMKPKDHPLGTLTNNKVPPSASCNEDKLVAAAPLESVWDQ